MQAEVLGLCEGSNLDAEGSSRVAGRAMPGGLGVLLQAFHRNTRGALGEGGV